MKIFIEKWSVKFGVKYDRVLKKHGGLRVLWVSNITFLREIDENYHSSIDICA